MLVESYLHRSTSALFQSSTILIPQRGGVPFDIALQILESKYNVKPLDRVYLPLGTQFNLEKECLSETVSSDRKRQIIKFVFDHHRELGTDLSNPILIDEVKSGASSWLLTKLLLESDIKKLEVIGMVDSSIESPDHWSIKLQKSKLKRRINTNWIRCPLLFCDNNDFMDQIISNENVAVPHTVLNQNLRILISKIFEEYLST